MGFDPVPMRKPVIYQLLPRLFGNKQLASTPWGKMEDNGVGKFADINDQALIAIRQFGATHVWYTGVLEHASVTAYPADGIMGDHPTVVKGRAGSPYAIRDYYDVCPDLALDVRKRMNEFDDLVERTHGHGLRVIIDFIPNHVARVYRSDTTPPGVEPLGAGDDLSVTFHPDNNFYYLPGEAFVAPASYVPLGGKPHPALENPYYEFPAKASGNDVFSAQPDAYSWFDTVKLNYGVDITGDGREYFDPVPDTWTKMRDILLFWVRKGIDGFRCDMAEMVPVAFWSWVIPQVKAEREDIDFIAEIYNADRYRTFVGEAGFDYLYDKVLLYDTLRQIMRDQHGTTAISRIRNQLSGVGPRLLHFLENHDEQRIASRHFAGDAWRAIPPMVVSATIDEGAVLVYFGQEVGEPALDSSGFSGDDGRTTIFDYWHAPEHQKWMNHGQFDGGMLSADQRKLRECYSDLLHLASSHPAIVCGEFAELVSNKDATFSYIRFHGNERLLVVVNLSDHEEVVPVQVTTDLALRIGVGSNFALRGIFGTDDRYRVTDGQCLITIGAWQGWVFTIEAFKPMD